MRYGLPFYGDAMRSEGLSNLRTNHCAIFFEQTLNACIRFFECIGIQLEFCEAAFALMKKDGREELVQPMKIQTCDKVHRAAHRPCEDNRTLGVTSLFDIINR